MSKQKPFKPAKTGIGTFPLSDEVNKMIEEAWDEVLPKAIDSKITEFATIKKFPKRGLRAVSGIIDYPFLNQKEIKEFRESIIHLYGSMENYVKSLEENVEDIWKERFNKEQIEISKSFSREYDSVWIDTDATPEEREEEKRRRNR